MSAFTANAETGQETAESDIEGQLNQALVDCNDCLNRSDFSGALKLLDHAVDLSPGNPEILSHRGRLLLFLKEFDRARADFAEAAQVDARSAPTLSGLARCHFEKESYHEAETCARRALEIDPKNQEAREIIFALEKFARAKSAKARKDIQLFYAKAQDDFAGVEPPPLSELHLKNSRVVPSREKILELVPKGGICAEIGTQTGNFARQILTILKPARLHIFDIDFTPFDHAPFQTAIQQGIIELHQGDSSSLLAALPDRSFDFIYIDGDHSYDGIVKDLDQAARKIKDDGWIVCNDYTLYSPLEKIYYGVYRAVNEFCFKHGFEIVYLGLHPWGYHDVALRKMRPPERNGHSPKQSSEKSTVRQLAETAPASIDPAPLTENRLRQLAKFVGDDWKQHPYYDEDEQHMDQQWRETVWPFIQSADFSYVLDLAAGHGRNSEKLKQHAKKIHIVDINSENIEFCKKRFAGDSRFLFNQNDGCSLNFIPSASISLVYCFDAMVHFDSDVVRAYLREFARVLRPNGLGFCHHSNYTQNPGGDVHRNPGWRNFMSQALFAHYCSKEGLAVVKSRVIDWELPGSDCITLFRKNPQL
jgi:ubiquinone/menaquinone biosynthesis C-methylase UbiE